MTTQEQLAERCSEVSTTARAALEWVVDSENADTVGLARKSLVHALRKGARRAEKLAKSARTKMSVSVFGPSQAGKSFLVSVLARPADGRLVADFQGPGGNLDYIGEINPIGEGESTGLVTRFTMTKDPCPEGFPIKLVLLSELDVVRTIINSFFLDGDQSEVPPEPEEISAHLDAFRAKMGTAEVPGMSFEDVLEIAEYVNTTPGIGRSAYGAALKTFWEDAAAITPYLALPDRARFYEILWGRHAALSDLYVRLGEGLAHIQHAEVVHAPLAALQPRETSIIDVATLYGLHSGEGGDLPLHLPSGATVDLPRALVCALAAELVMPMQTQPSEIFGETDLLDFPGARNRFEQPLSKTLGDLEKNIPQLLLRGKVAYLFDRYVENQEITSMLLCVPDSNMETLSLPGLVENWIGLTHGNTPKLRAETNCVLFFVMTKFDKHLGESAADGSAEERFDRRVKASLSDGFGRSDDSWVQRWTVGQPFQNCYWLRNPNYFVEGLIDYDDAQRELRIRNEKVARVGELREGCLTSDRVKRHFADPAKAWDAALGLNDGGVGYLIEQLTKVCTPESKIRQIGTQIEKLANDLRNELQPFHVSDDIEKRLKEKEAAAEEIIDGLEIALQRHRFGAVLASLMVDQDTVRDRISRVPSSVRISSAVTTASAAATPAQAATAAVRPPVRPTVRPNVGGKRPESPKPVETTTHSGDAAKDIRTMTPEAFQTETSVEVWIEGLKRFRDDADTLAHFGLTQASVANLNVELTHALRRVGIVDSMKAQLRAMSFGLTVDKQAEPAAIVCAEGINNFVSQLGMDQVAVDQRPSVTFADGTSRKVFEPRQGFDSADNLPPVQRAAGEDLWTDWVFSLHALFAANAKDGDAGEVNIEQNLKLGEILSRLENGVA